MTSIRSETPGDHKDVRRVTLDAFTACEFGHEGEADLIDLLRTNCERYLSLVALDCDAVVGHILFTPASVKNEDTELHGMGLAPMAVAPSHQNNGIGSSLIRSGLEHLSRTDCQFVVVLGHPQYYPRFGFERASEYGITHGFAGIPQDVFFVNMLSQNSIQSISNGLAIYRPEFGPQHDGT